MIRKLILIIITIITFYSGRWLGLLEGHVAAQTSIVFKHTRELDNFVTMFTLKGLELKADSEKCYNLLEDTIENFEEISNEPVDSFRDTRRFINKYLRENENLGGW